eukprot:11194036-Lingulodinium_polyedra.AAC.1
MEFASSGWAYVKKLSEPVEVQWVKNILKKVLATNSTGRMYMAKQGEKAEFLDNVLVKDPEVKYAPLHIGFDMKNITIYKVQAPLDGAMMLWQ